MTNIQPFSYLKRKNIELVFNRQSDVVVQTDAKAIERVLNNLVDNAFKYSSENTLHDIFVANRHLHELSLNDFPYFKMEESSQINLFNFKLSIE